MPENASVTPAHKSRAHALLSASGAHRWMICTASPFAEAPYPNTDTAYTAEGTAAHEVAQSFAEAVAFYGAKYVGELPKLRRQQSGREDCTEEMLCCAEGYAAYIAEQVQSKDTVILAEQRLDFSRWVPEGFGTGDCIIIADGVLTVIDYKYGMGVKVEAAHNPQMLLYALGAIEAYTCIYSFDHVRMAIYQPRMNNVSEATVSVTELLAWAENELVPKAKEAYAGKGKFVPGEHCRFCKHAAACRALAEASCNFAEHHGLRVAVPKLTDAEYLECFRTIPQIELWIRKIKAAITDRLLAGETIEGLKLVAGRSTRAWSDPARAIAALDAAGIPAADYMEQPTLLSPAALEKALGKKKAAALVGDCIETKPGNPTPAEASDKRQAFDPSADFENLDKE